MSKNNVFISHSSENKEIVLQLSAYIERLGVKPKHIFCSSIISQGVKNGEKLGSSISGAINKSKVLIFLLSYDFINSPYCMQELGVGWHLSEQGRAKCFCLVLPDISLSEVTGFINSKIFKFTFIDEQHKDELGLFAENLCKELDIKKPTHSKQTNYENIFYSAIRDKLNLLVEAKEKIQLEKEKTEHIIENLKKEIIEKEKSIKYYRVRLSDSKNESERVKLKIEMRSIEMRFYYLAFQAGISRTQYQSFSKAFWFDMLNRYKEIEQQLGIGPHDHYMEFLIAIIYAMDGNEICAYEHIKNYVRITDNVLYMQHFSNFFEGYHGTMVDIIDILAEKLKTEKEGLARDSYIRLISDLKKRETDIMEAPHA